MKFWPFGKKAVESKKRQYAAAQWNRLVAGWVAMSTSQDAELKGSLRLLRARSRQLGRDNDFVRGAFRAFQNNVVGLGVGFQSQVRRQRGGKLDDVTNDAIETAWYRWSRKQHCDVAGQLSFSDMERLVIRSVVESGEVLVRKIRQSFGGSAIPFALEVIEADLLDDDYNGKTEAGNEIRFGVEKDSWGRPVAYYFHEKHPGDYQFQGAVLRSDRRRRIPADEIIHLYVFERANQTRGVPWLVSSMIRLHHLHGYEEASVIAARAGAALMGFIQSPEGELKGDDIENGERVTEFQPGVFKYLAPGETVNVPSIDRPKGEFDPFMRAMLRAMASGVGASYESISKDFSQTNYSSSRLSLLEERDYWKVLQRWMIENFHQPIFEAWLDMAVLSNSLSLAGFDVNPARYYESIRWLPRGWAWVDPQKEVEAYKTAIRSGFATISDVVAQSGSDFEEVMIQRQREIDTASQLGLVLDTDPAKVAASGQVLAPDPSTQV